MTTAHSLSDINFVDPDVFVRGEQHAMWRLLRRKAPVFWNEGTPEFPGFWCMTKYDDVMTVSRDPATFISGKGITLNLHPDFNDPAFGRMMIMTDPPRHVRMRRLVNKGFTPRMVAQMEPHVRTITTSIIDEIAAKGSCDFVTEVAARLPLAVICGMMGVPRQDWDLMFSLTNRTLGPDDPEYQTTPGDPNQTSQLAVMEMMSYYARMVLERREQVQDDLVSVLVGSDIDGEKLTDEELLYFCFLLIVAGNETTRNATSGGMLALIEHPHERARLRADAALMPSAIEEILRYTSPVMHMARLCVRDTVIRGQPIKANDKVVMWYPSANRDEDVFAEPDRFDISRTPNDHLAFGIGEHFCLGAGLARLELRVMFEELLKRAPDMELAGQVERLRSNFIGGIKHMPVRFTPSA
ncbi:MAG: cytochrome P450 [Chloroflexi bacterium]|nr:cytochrome P450 [Chloroflexota bacterium]